MLIPVTEASKLIGSTVNRSDRTVREYRSIFNGNEYSFPDTLQGKYQRNGVLWQNEMLNKYATKFVRENAAVKVTTENIQNYFRKVRHYMFAYVEGFKGGPDLEKQIIKYKKLYKSHRKVGVND